MFIDIVDIKIVGTQAYAHAISSTKILIFSSKYLPNLLKQKKYPCLFINYSLSKIMDGFRVFGGLFRTENRRFFGSGSKIYVEYVLSKIHNYIGIILGSKNR